MVRHVPPPHFHNSYYLPLIAYHFFSSILSFLLVTLCLTPSNILSDILQHSCWRLSHLLTLFLPFFLTYQPAPLDSFLPSCPMHRFWLRYLKGHLCLWLSRTLIQFTFPSCGLLLRICFVLPWSADLFRWCRFFAGSRALRSGLDTEAAWIKKKTVPFAAAVLEGTGTPSKQICTRGILSRPFRGFRQKDRHCFWQSVLWWYHLGGCHFLFDCAFCCPWAKYQPAYLCLLFNKFVKNLVTSNTGTWSTTDMFVDKLICWTVFSLVWTLVVCCDIRMASKESVTGATLIISWASNNWCSALLSPWIIAYCSQDGRVSGCGGWYSKACNEIFSWTWSSSPLMMS